MTADQSSTGLVLQYRLERGAAIITVSGELDLRTSGVLRDSLLRLVTDEEKRTLVVNLAGVTFIDSTGIGVLVGIWRRLKASDGTIVLAAPSEPVRLLLDMAGVAAILSVYDGEEDAIQAAGS